MMLSPRRFWCVVCLGAVATGGMLIEPVRQFANRSAFNYIFGGNVSVANLQLHRHQELLEFNELTTTQFDDAVQVTATADVALVKLDMPTLLDRRFVSSRVKLQNVQIELTSSLVQKPIARSDRSWQKSLEEVTSAFRWENLREDCEAILKSDSVLNELDQRMRGWLLRSQQIMFHGDQLSRAVQAHSNPLRQQNEIRNQLAQLEQLRLEQDNLQKQFSGVNTLIANQLKEIESMGERDIAAIRTKCDASALSLRGLAAEQIVSEWGNQLITPQLQLSQAFATLLQSGTRSNPYDVNVRRQSTTTPILSISGIVADGFMSDSTKRFPFSAKGEYSTVQKVDYQLERSTDWEIQFDADQISTQLQLLSVASSSAWKIKSTTDERSADAIDSSKMLMLEASLSGRELAGKARMNLGMYRAFTKLSCAANADLAVPEPISGSTTAGVAPFEEWIEFALSGSAFAPHAALLSKLPAEFTNTITESVQSRIETQRTDIESKLKLALSAKTDELTAHLGLLVKSGQQTLAKQREELTSMHRQLEQSLQSTDGFEYARLPTKSNTNH